VICQSTRHAVVTFDKHPAGGTEHPPITIAPQSLPRRVSDREGSQLRPSPTPHPPQHDLSSVSILT
jgi:hypothetical protein